MADLAVQSGLSAKEIDGFVNSGLVSGADESGGYDAGNVTRLRLIKALQRSGIPMDKLAVEVAGGRLSFDFAGSVVADPVGLAAITLEQAFTDVGVTPESLRRLMLALGVAYPASNSPIREDDLEMMRIYASAQTFGLPEQVVLGTFRTFSISIRRLVDASRALVREQVEDPMLARGIPYHEMFARGAPTRVALQRLAYRIAFLLQRRMFEQAIYDNLILRFEEALEESHVTRPRRVLDQAIVFVDLSGFTERTENLGDDHAASIGSALVEIAQAQATLHNGQVVKPLGDGAMVHFGKAENAVRFALRVVALGPVSALPPVRAAIAVGPLVSHDGDYYGRTVNRASRLLDVAEPGQVLVTGEVPGKFNDANVRFTQLGAVKLRGVDGDVYACAAVAA
jgi:adenylate cyclase